MRRPPLFTVLALTAGCATPTVDKMSWEEAMRPAPSRKAARAKDAKADQELDATLRAFIEASKAARRQTGETMPPGQAAAWSALVTYVDHFLEKPVKQTSLFDVARARVVVESELEFDAQAYGDIPSETALEVQASVRRLASRLNEVMALTQRPKVSPRRFWWPVAPVMVTSPFGDRLHPITGDYRTHRGVDLLAGFAQPVRAAFSGTVVFAGWQGAHGKTLHVVHDQHWSTRYSHLCEWEVDEGDFVARGQVIGYAGSTGQSTGPHVHFELLHEGEPVDPQEEMSQLPTLPVAFR